MTPPPLQVKPKNPPLVDSDTGNVISAAISKSGGHIAPDANPTHRIIKNSSHKSATGCCAARPADEPELEASL